MFKHVVCFVLFVIAALVNYLYALFALSPKRLVHTLRVVSDNFIGNTENIFRTAIILFQFVYSARRKMLSKLIDIRRVRPTPAVYTLVIVTDYENIAVLVGKQAHESILNFVGILKLVYVDILKSRLVFVEHVLVHSKKLQRLVKQIVKVERIVGFEFRLVARVYLGYEFPLGFTLYSQSVFSRTECVVFRIGYVPADKLFVILFIVNFQSLENTRNYLFAVLVVIYGKV